MKRSEFLAMICGLAVAPFVPKERVIPEYPFTIVRDFEVKYKIWEKQPQKNYSFVKVVREIQQDMMK